MDKINTVTAQMTKTIIDGNEAAASVAYRTNEVIAIYPITPSSPMGEWADAWAAEGRPNIWGTVPTVMEMQSEGGAAGAVHGALQTGALTTTFTASQGLLLMIPNMYKIAGELTASVFHIAARTVATHALSIFGDHSDVMATRGTGFAMIASASVQEVMDFALIAQAATLQSRIPFLHFFDGFRTSHEVSKIDNLPDDTLRAMIDNDLIAAHRGRALSPDRPVIRGTAQNPDVFFQARETVNRYYNACAGIVQEVMDKFAELTGRAYRLFEYHGVPNAERIIVLMGSGCETVHETVDYLNTKDEKVGVIKVRLYRPFDIQSFVGALPGTTKAVAVLDRTKEPGSGGEPLFLDCVHALEEGIPSGYGQLKTMPKIIGGRYGLSSKEFTPAMVKAVFDNLAKVGPKNHFTVGIQDDITHTSLEYDPEFDIESPDQFRALFYGLGSDGTVSANRNSIKIIGENTPNYAQGYFVYDSKKAGAVTISHLRFGPKMIRSPYLISKAHFLGCHQTVFLERYDMLRYVMDGGTFLLNTPYGPQEVWDRLPQPVQDQIIKKHLRFFVIDAYNVARESGMGNRINTVMQVCFFAISGVLPKAQAIDAIKDAVRKTYGKKGEEIVQMNLKAVDHSLGRLFEVKVPARAEGKIEMPPPVSKRAPDFVRNVLGKMIENKGDELPVSAFPEDGTFPTGTATWEKRNIALEIPVWDPQVCIQCGKCSFVCPHGVIRMKVYDPKYLQGAPETFKSTDARDLTWKGMKYTVQVAPEDCTGCAVCVDVCPAKNKSQTRLKAINMESQPPLREKERANWEFFLRIPDLDRRQIKVSMIRQQQVQVPLFEFSGACGGCGETPYIKLATQLFGDRMIIANATGCSSIYGGNLPTTPYTKNADGRGPAWCNSLFEDNAEFGLGYRLAIDKQKELASEILKRIAGQIGSDLVNAILNAQQKDEASIYEQRERVAILKQKLTQLDTEEAKRLLPIADMLVKKSVWIIGGDGWAYDIGFGGLDHVIASGRDVNLLVLDTEVYSNTGGQMSKSTPRAAVAKFAAGGKPSAKKDLGLIAMSYGNVYVASVAMGARDEHTLKAFLEAEAYEGPSLIIAYSHCIAHGIQMSTSFQNQKVAVESGQWLLYRYNPDRIKQGENPLQFERLGGKIPVEQYLSMENRFKMLTKSKPERAKRLFQEAQQDVKKRLEFYEYLAQRKFGPSENPKETAR
ncbi:MAG: pyruvate:ferredoxin (flavodoxin) oxidoreductase [Candidatus Omnitrophica bacterium]|nr:pyruvate:ferredoxin (flavodoxin) oxidoreductase [Candidatus Omnitrophota bacterium]